MNMYKMSWKSLSEPDLVGLIIGLPVLGLIEVSKSYKLWIVTTQWPASSWLGRGLKKYTPLDFT